MKSLVIKRSIVIDGHKTSVSLEDAFWSGLREIAHDEHMTLSKMVSDIDGKRRQGNLSSAIRLFVLDHVRTVALGDRAAVNRMNEGRGVQDPLNHGATHHVPLQRP